MIVMVRKLLNIVFCLFFAATVVGCADNAKVLDRVERVIVEQPDSALSILNGIDTRTLISRRSRAKYALLLSQAKDKCFIDETNDSLINIAVSYYKDRGCSSDRMKSYYYLGRVYYNAGLYPQANVAFTLAESDATALSDYFYAGLIYRGMAWGYNATFNNKEENEYAVKSYDCFVKADADLYAAYALFGIGVSKLNRKLFHEAIKDLIKAVDYAQQLDNVNLEVNARQTLSTIYIELEDPEKAFRHLQYVKDTLKYPLDYEWYTNYAGACILSNQLDSVTYYLESARNLVDSNSTEYQKYQNQIYNLYKKNGNYKSALDTYISIAMYQDSLVRSILEESVIAYQRDYLQEQHKLTSYKLKSFKMLSIAIIILLLLIIVIVYRQKYLKSILVRVYMDKVCELENHMLHNTGKIDNMSLLIKKLFHDKFELINNLCRKYYERKNTYSEQISIYDDVKKNIEKIGSNTYTSSELEKIINECCDNIMAKMRSQLPHFRETDFQLISYIIAGFSYQAISVFMDTKIENLYKRMYRLRDRINSSEAPDKEFFLKEIG